MSRSGKRKRSIGRYQVITRLAVGGMSEVFLACERGVGGFERLVVIKRILPHLAAQESFVNMFLREARFIARLNSPHVVQIYELGETRGTYYLAMEYLHGSTLRELQYLCEHVKVRIPLGVAIGIVTQAAHGLHAAHEIKDLDGRPLGLVHRDVSPHNVMVSSDGHIKLIDFGVAKATEGIETTYSDGLKGKFPYMSPEQCRHDPVDRRSDLFSLGILLWELLTDRKLFRRDNEMAIMRAIVEEDPPPPRSIDPTIPPVFEELSLKSLARNPEDRFQTADEMRRALTAAATDLSLDISADAIALFVQGIAGDKLAERRVALQSALDQTFRSADRARLLHQTGSTASALPQGQIAGRSGLSSSWSGQPRSSRPSMRSLLGWLKPQSDPVLDRLGYDELIPELEVPAPRWPGKRLLLVSALLLALAIPLGLWWLLYSSDPGGTGTPAGDTASLPPPPTGPPLPICWPPYVQSEVLLDELALLQGYLERTLDQPVPLTLGTSYTDCADQVTSGRAAFGILTPLLVVRIQQTHPEMELLAIKQYEGATTYDGWLMVRTDSTYHALPDLAGRRFCFIDPDSSSGYFLPRLFIREEGFDPDTFIGSIRWSGDHLQALRDIVDGRCDAVGTYNGALYSADSLGIPVGRLRFLAVTGTVPQDAIVASPSTPRVDRDRMREALLGFDPQRHLGMPRLGNVERITGFSPPRLDSYNDLRRAIEIDGARRP